MEGIEMLGWGVRGRQQDDARRQAIMVASVGKRLESEVLLRHGHWSLGPGSP